MKSRILIVEAEDQWRNALRSALMEEGYTVLVANHADEALIRFLDSAEISLLVTGFRFSGKNGIELIEEFVKKHYAMKSILVHGDPQKEELVQAIQKGVSDYFEKSGDVSQLVAAIGAHLKKADQDRQQAEIQSKLANRIIRLEGKLEDQFWYMSKSSAMSRVNESLLFLRKESMRGESKEAFVLVSGEPGSGHEGLARMIHMGSRRGKSSWVRFNCGKRNSAQIESDWIGHGPSRNENGQIERQSIHGVFELAKGGTLLLQQVDELEISMQEKLLKVIQDGKYIRGGDQRDLDFDVRIVATTFGDLKAKVKEGKFHQDLYKLLAEVDVHLPALRDRAEDVLPIAAQFGERFCKKYGKKFVGFSPETEQFLKNQPWNGHIEELFHTVGKAVLTWQGQGRVQYVPNVEEVSSRLQLVHSVENTSEIQSLNGVDNSYTEIKKKWCDSFERDYLVKVLDRNQGNVSAAAREAKLDRSNFLRLMRRHGIKSESYRKIAA